MTVVDRLKPLTSTRMRRSVLRARMRARRTLPGARLLPDFLVIGAQRSGTSSLYKYLGAHPEIAPSLRKEVGYFTRSYGEDPDWYRAHFPLAARRLLAARLARRKLLSFEATPDYLFDPRAAGRAHQLVPAAKLIVLLREPVARAFSHHQHMTRLGFETLSFEAAIDREPERLAADLAAMAADPLHDPRHYLWFSYASRGRYAEQLERWFARYGRERCLVIESEDLYADPDRTFQQILAFLGVARWSPRSFDNHSYQGRRPATDDIPRAARARLAAHFAAPNQDLARLLGREPGWIKW
ncbi:hypothetical protein BH20ACT2_BH20ACT2_10070 [soil metagenome]